MHYLLNNIPVLVSIIALLVTSYNVVINNYRVIKKQNDDAIVQNTKVLVELINIKEDTGTVRGDLNVIKDITANNRDRILTLEKDVEVLKSDVIDIKKGY